MTIYKLITDPISNEVNMVLLNDAAFVPFDPANGDYQKYLEWVAEGNTPEPADSGEE